MDKESMSRRSFLKHSLLTVGSLGMLVGMGGVYGVFGERNWIETTTVKLSYPKYPSSFAGLRIVQFSDSHISKYYGLSHLTKLVDLLQRQEPDILVFTGDLFDSNQGQISTDIIPILSRLQASEGKFAVLGNHDMRLGADKVKEVLEQSGFSVLVNESRTLTRGDESIHIIGIDEMFYGSPNLPRAIQSIDEDEFVILLAHEPDFADTALRYPVDLQLSGHSHGGQIRIPIYGSLFTPDLGQKYSIGLYSFEGSNFQVYTNRGIGTTLFPIRFNCRPEITIFDIERKII